MILISPKVGFLVCCQLVVMGSANAQSGYIDKYITEPFTLSTIASSTQSVSSPRDLDFKPNSNELWVINKGNSNGGTVVIIYDAGLPTQTSQYRKDSHSGHFMGMPSAIAFGKDGFFANTNEIKNTADPSSTFMGPALWSADTAIYARVFQNDWEPGLPLGSHYDMLHQSPFSMGIAHDTALLYWVNDGHNGNICKYDYRKHHGPGYDDHSAGMIWRYSDVTVTRVPNVPSHMILDKTTGWLYYIDGGSKKLKRLNTLSGTNAGNLIAPASGAEPLAGYWNMTGAVVEELDAYTTQPCGIDFLDNRLIVSDYTNGNIYLYTVGTTVTKVKTINTGKPGMMGVKFGPDSRIWCVNNTDNTVYRLDIPNPANDVALIALTEPANQNFMRNFYYTGNNVCEASVTPKVSILNRGTNTISTVNFQYTLDNASPQSHTWTGSLASGATAQVTFPATAVTGGTHLLHISAINMNGNIDNIVQNNAIQGSFRVVTQHGSSGTFSQDFSSTEFPPAGWNYIHYNPNNVMSRVTAGGFGNSTGCLKMDNFSGEENITGQIDYLMTPEIDFSANTSGTLQFSVAYAQYNSTSNDKLQVLASIDCGLTWAEVYSKQGAQLATAGNMVTANWTPTATQWRKEAVNISSYKGKPNVQFMFATTNDFGNNLYLDDINLDSAAITGIDAQALQPDLFAVYPNPSGGIIWLSFPDQRGTTSLTGGVYSYDGKRVNTFSVPGHVKQMQLDLSTLPPGIYAIQLSNGQNSITKSVVKR